MTKEEFQTIAVTIPHKPGIYKYLDAAHKIIYVGKAKNLRKRVSSYFNKISDYYKTRKLVSEIVSIEFTIVDSEQDAFLLENSLIKQHQPKYNIELKDDKTYPHIVIKNEPFPRIFLTRRKIKDGSQYLGPYTSVEQVKNLLDLLRNTLLFRTCNLNLSEAQIAKGKYKACLEYHIGNCKAPCVGLQTREDYDWQVTQAKEVLQGKMGDILKQYKQEMQTLAANLEFEKAEIMKKRIEYIKNYQSKSIIVNTRIDQVDVCSIISNEDDAFLNFMIIMQGSIVQTHSLTVRKKLEETDAEILQILVPQLREKFGSRSREVIVPIPVENVQDILFTVPRAGDRKKLLELSLQNATHFYQDQKRKKALMIEEATEEDNRKLLEQLQLDLHLKELPQHIECFDNSNFQGAYPVAAMVCFKNALPSNKEYRHFHIKTVEGINDFASMKEVVYRRYKRLLDEQKPLPQLIIIDGGKGQLSSAMESIDALGLRGKLAVVGLAKNVEELFYPGERDSLKLPYQSATLNLIKRIRDEVHRFGITFHRKTRSKGIVKNELQTIEGIGPKTAEQLLKHFRSVKNIRAASREEIVNLLGEVKTDKLLSGLNPDKNQTPS
ncbi:MAG: excinuclease ABC subunit UvrC [Chitinophagaceae bacterium]|nr:excinuclease ABC subunit UvrC [Chitinophagaceae bacterium]